MKKNLHKLLFLFLLIIPIGLSAQISDLIISEYGESGTNDYLEIYNGTGATVDLSNYLIWKITNDGFWYERAFQMNGMLPHGETFTIVSYNADSTLLSEGDATGPVSGVDGSDYTFMITNGNEAWGIAKIVTAGDTILIDAIGTESASSPDPWDVAGIVGGAKEHTLVRKGNVAHPNPDWASSAGTDADNSEWIVYPAAYWDNVGFHSDYTSAFATDLFFSEYCDNGSNDYLEIFNGTGEDVDLTNYYIWKIINAGNWYARAYHLEGTLSHGSTFTVMSYKADSALFTKSDVTGPVIDVDGSTFTLMVTNGNEAFAIAKYISPGDTIVIDVIGKESGETSPASWDVAGVTGAAKEHVLIRKSTVCSPNPDWDTSAGTNEEDSEWIIYDPTYWTDVDKHSMYCGPLTETTNVRFKVDMNQQTVAPEGVHIAGNFQGWNPSSTAMTDADNDGVWEITIAIDQNTNIEYKFINGDAWGEDETVPGACAQNNNRFLAVGTEDIDLDPVCYASCGPCSGVFQVTFRVDMSEQTVAASGVHIAGNFQGWDPGASEMTDVDNDQIYEATFELGGNTSYQYKFINGDFWGFDEAVPADCAQDNNRFVEVETSNVVTEAICYGKCGPCSTDAFDLALEKSITVFPNPNQGQFTLSAHLTISKELNVKVSNMMGQILEERNILAGAGSMSIPFSIDMKGILILEITGENGKVIRKVMVE